MSESYEEIIEGEMWLRPAPDARHEAICGRLHEAVATCVSALPSIKLLSPRSVVQLGAGTILRPDLALVTAATGKLWLAAEIVHSKDHRIDTVRKKNIYEEWKLPRLWMIDPRYDNVETYQCGPYGLSLSRILANREILSENLLPGFAMPIGHLFDRE